MNNKYLAIGLAIAAVLIVFYQLVLNKKPVKVKPVTQQTAAGAIPAANQPPANQPPANQPPVNQPSVNQPPANQPPATAADDGLNIDYSSPLLLKKVYESPLEEYPQMELDSQFGTAIFSTPQKEETASIQTLAVTEVQFLLNSIVIDSTRQVAVINNTIVQTGDFISGAEVVDIQKSKVVLKLKENLIQLSMDSPIQTITLSGGTGDK